MKNNERKKLQKEYVIKNINFFLNHIKNQNNSDLDKECVKEIKDLSTSFNIRLKREEKLLFCKNCHIFWNTKTLKIRLNSKTKTKEYICKDCGFIRRFKY